MVRLQMRGKDNSYFRNKQYLCRKNRGMSKIIGMGNALTDMLATQSDDSLSEVPNLSKGSMPLIDENNYLTIKSDLGSRDELSAVEIG